MPLDIIHGKGYRVVNKDRTIGGPTSAPDGYVVVNQANNKIFLAASGVWTNGGTFPNASFTSQNMLDWKASTGDPNE